MKFKDEETGMILDDIGLVQSQQCEKMLCNCNKCPISIHNNRRISFCSDLCARYPAEAAELMGYDVLK